MRCLASCLRLTSYPCVEVFNVPAGAACDIARSGEVIISLRFFSPPVDSACSNTEVFGGFHLVKPSLVCHSLLPVVRLLSASRDLSLLIRSAIHLSKQSQKSPSKTVRLFHWLMKSFKIPLERLNKRLMFRKET